jgi:hypothetical protein
VTEIFVAVKDFFFNLFVLIFFVLGATLIVIHELGRVRRTWRAEMSRPKAEASKPRQRT